MAAVETPDARQRPLRAEEAVAGFPDLLQFAPPERAGSCRRNTSSRSGEDGFKKAPVGAGPYKFVSFTPGVELVLEAFEGYWRKTPAVKRLVFKVVPEEATRLAALKRGEVDHRLLDPRRAGRGTDARRRDSTLKPVVIQGTFWLYFPDQWDPKSPWHDQRVREAARLAIDYKSISEALTLGLFADHQQHHPRQFRLLLEGAGGRFTTWQRPSSCWPRRGSATASMPATTPATRPTPISPRRCSTTSRRSASA